jgi:drug/metabolite transporter (DMT)-like permease
MEPRFVRRQERIMRRIHADLLLLLVALIWGTAFIAQKHANESLGPVSFVGMRFLLSCFSVAPLAYYERKRDDCAPLTGRDWGLAGLIGLCLFVGASLQQIGLVTTTATNGGFLTALYVIFVPLIVWAVNGNRPRAVVFVASLVSIAGAWLLTEKGQFQRWASGDTLVLIADFAWAAGISLVPVFLSRADRPFFLSFTQYGLAAIFGLAGGLGFESFSSEGLASALPAILYAGFCSGGIAYTLQIVAQKHTPPAEAAMIMSLESVFAALAGAILLSERLTGWASLGCALLLSSVIFVEAGPALRDFGARRRGW